ncbi:hypothetical protein BD779DRAFT_1470080 [Infundibulicybe gibba]|nr:hypothetical protein BD779DRAFT_1470080 [Infundibulicybe gibba]
MYTVQQTTGWAETGRTADGFTQVNYPVINAEVVAIQCRRVRRAAINAGPPAIVPHISPIHLRSRSIPLAWNLSIRWVRVLGFAPFLNLAASSAYSMGMVQSPNLFLKTPGLRVPVYAIFCVMVKLAPEAVITERIQLPSAPKHGGTPNFSSGANRSSGLYLAFFLGSLYVTHSKRRKGDLRGVNAFLLIVNIVLFLFTRLSSGWRMCSFTGSMVPPTFIIQTMEQRRMWYIVSMLRGGDVVSIGCGVIYSFSSIPAGQPHISFPLSPWRVSTTVSFFGATLIPLIARFLDWLASTELILSYTLSWRTRRSICTGDSLWLTVSPQSLTTSPRQPSACLASALIGFTLGSAYQFIPMDAVGLHLCGLVDLWNYSPDGPRYWNRILLDHHVGGERKVSLQWAINNCDSSECPSPEVLWFAHLSVVAGGGFLASIIARQTGPVTGIAFCLPVVWAGLGMGTAPPSGAFSEIRFSDSHDTHAPRTSVHK